MNNDMTQYHKHGMSWVGYILRNHGITIPLNQVFKWRIFSARPMGVYGWCRFLRGVSQVLDTPWHEKQLVRRYGRSQCNRRVSEFSLIQEYKSHQNPGTSVLLFSSIIFPDFMSHRNPQGQLSDSGAPRFQSPCWVCLCLPGCSVLVRTKGRDRQNWTGSPSTQNGSSLGLRDGMGFRFETSNSFGSLILKFWPMHLIT